MSDTPTRVEPIGRETLRVRFIHPVEVAGRAYGAGEYETDTTPDAANELVQAGRAEIVGEELRLTDEERAALPQLEPLEVEVPHEAAQRGAEPVAEHQVEQPAAEQPHAPDDHVL